MEITTSTISLICFWSVLSHIAGRGMCQLRGMYFYSNDPKADSNKHLRFWQVWYIVSYIPVINLVFIPLLLITYAVYYWRRLNFLEHFLEILRNFTYKAINDYPRKK